mgnify:CR=1 FL=1
MGPLITVAELRGLLDGQAARASEASRGPQGVQGGASALVLLDCGFDLFNTAAGRAAWEKGHLPGALQADLEAHLSAPKSPRGSIEGGRHPLPRVEDWAQQLGKWGIGPDTTVVAYDDQGGCYAARAWWMLRWVGHSRVAVLDGGKSAWVAAGGVLESAATVAGAIAGSSCNPYPLSTAKPAQSAMRTVAASELLASLGRVTLVDARAGERYRGETEPLDARAGHIPGAVNRFFKDNLRTDGHFKSPEQLRQEWSPLLPSAQQGGGPDASEVIHQCGSGVTACHNLLALAHAGLGEGRLYPGSWSEWSADPARPCAIG